MVVVEEKENRTSVNISEKERYKLQLLNAYVDRAKLALENAKIRMENARLGMAMAQREIDVSNADLSSFGKELAEKYRFNLQTDSVNWETGEIKRGQEEYGVDEDET